LLTGDSVFKVFVEIFALVGVPAIEETQLPTKSDNPMHKIKTIFFNFRTSHYYLFLFYLKSQKKMPSTVYAWKACLVLLRMC
jgi:hypothetical protein